MLFFRNARARNTHGEATLNHSFPAQADGDGELDEDEFVAMMDAVADKPAKPGVVRRMLSGGLPSLSKEITWPGADNEKRHSAENTKAARVKEAIAVL